MEMWTPDRCRGDEAVELYFYDELPAGERTALESHLAVCAACRESLADLRAIGDALGDRGADAVPIGGWRAFMARLDARMDAAPARTIQPSSLPTTLFRLAAAVTLVAAGAIGGWTLSRVTPVEPAAPAPAGPAVDRAIADAGDSGLARARVVLAGLAQKEDGAEWSLERRMAATLLPEVRLIRQVAADRGRGDLTDILIDVETLLLQASYTESDDAETLARLRSMIDRRDVLMRLSVAAADAGAEDPSPGSKRGL